MARGGKRQNAGRKSTYGSQTKPIRIPEELLSVVQQFVLNKGYKLPLYESKLSAGFPSPADDYLEAHLDLHSHLIKHPASTFFVRANGESMINAGIHENDILVVDRSIKPTNGKIAIAAVDGQLTVKRIDITANGKLTLLPDNPNFKPIEISEDSTVVIWGIVTSVIHLV